MTDARANVVVGVRQWRWCTVLSWYQVVGMLYILYMLYMLYTIFVLAIASNSSICLYYILYATYMLHICCMQCTRLQKCKSIEIQKWNCESTKVEF